MFRSLALRISLPVLLYVFFCPSIGLSQDRIELSVANIPDSLLRNANAVIRHQKIETHINGIDDLVTKYERVITVINQKADYLLDVQVGFKEGSSTVKKLKIEYYNETGNIIREVSKKEIQEGSSGDGYSIISDYRQLYYDFETKDFPITIVYSYELHNKNTYIPTWDPISNYRVSVELSEYSIINKANLSLRSKEILLDDRRIVKKSQWNFVARNMTAVVRENYAPEIYIKPMLIVDSNEFVHENLKGIASTWKDMGIWQYNKFLSKNQFKDSDLFIELDQKISDTLSKIEKAKIIYDYVQENTRYISITLDEGGYMPMNVSQVHELKYGDCKALTHYTQSILKNYGIKSDYAIVHADEDKISIFQDYCSLYQGNHAILRIPIDKDTIWLECTSHDSPFNFLGDYTDDRLVFVTGENGGEIVKTPDYGSSFNHHLLNGTINLGTNDPTEMKLICAWTGMRYADIIYLANQDDKTIREFFTDIVYSRLKNPNIESYQFSFDEDSIRAVSTVKLQVDHFEEQLGEYIVFPYRITSLNIPYLRKDKNRVFPIEFQRDYERHSDIEYLLPAGYELLEDNYNYELEEKYGYYKITVNNQEDKVIVKRVFKLDADIYPNNEYGKLRSFFNKIRKLETGKLTLKKTD